MIELTCRNHRGAKYLTKGSHRTLFFVRADESVTLAALEADPAYANKISAGLVTTLSEVPISDYECSCPVSDLVTRDMLAALDLAADVLGAKVI